MSEKKDPQYYVTLSDCMDRHITLENRLTKVENRQLVEIVIMIAGFALTISNIRMGVI